MKNSITKIMSIFILAISFIACSSADYNRVPSDRGDGPEAIQSGSLELSDEQVEEALESDAEVVEEASKIQKLRAAIPLITSEAVFFLKGPAGPALRRHLFHKNPVTIAILNKRTTFSIKHNLAIRKNAVKFQFCTLAAGIVGDLIAGDRDTHETVIRGCASSFYEDVGRKLTSQDIAEVYNAFPWDVLDHIILGKKADGTKDLENLKEVERLCLKNPLGPTVFTPEENAYYCKLNVGFRGCNLLKQKKAGMTREQAFSHCSSDQRYGLNAAERATYRKEMAAYMKKK